MIKPEIPNFLRKLCELAGVNTSTVECTVSHIPGIRIVGAKPEYDDLLSGVVDLVTRKQSEQLSRVEQDYCRQLERDREQFASVALQELVAEKSLYNFVPIRMARDDNAYYWLAIVELRSCARCKAPMTKQNWSAPQYGGPFPYWMQIDLAAQMRRAGWQYWSSATIDGEVICQKCADSGEGSFVCALCGERRSTALIQESVGDPAEHLCRTCYETVPAKVWEEKYEALREEHKYDYE